LYKEFFQNCIVFIKFNIYSHFIPIFPSPKVDCKEEHRSDKEGYAAWVRELSEVFKPKGLLLSAAVSPSKKVIDYAYDVPSIARDLDWISVMTYDYHGHWDKKTGHVSPMYHHPESEFDYFNTVSVCLT
jgi:chitinase